MIQLITLRSNDQAIIINNKILTRFDPQFDRADLNELADNLAEILGLKLQTLHMETPSDDDWNWGDILETLPVLTHSVFSMQTVIEAFIKVKEALENVPCVGEIYDQHHSDTHMEASQILDQLNLTEQNRESNTISTFQVTNRDINQEEHLVHVARSGDTSPVPPLQNSLTTWPDEYAKAALLEGWFLSESSEPDSPLQIQKFDNSSSLNVEFQIPDLEDDRHAWKILINGKSEHHRLARELISKQSKGEWMHIQEYALCLHFGITGEHSDGYGFDIQENEFQLPCGTIIPLSYTQLCDERLEMLIEMIELHRQSELRKENAIAVDRLKSAGYEASSDGEVISVKDPYITYNDGQQVTRTNSTAVTATDIEKFLNVRS